MTRLAPLAAAAALLIGGAYGYATEATVPGVALLAAGLITLGAWITLECLAAITNVPDDDPGQPL